MQRDRGARWLRVILLCAAVLVSGLGIGELGNAATSLSVLVDPAYDGGPAPYLDIRSARVVQLDTDLLQFEMTLGGPPLRDTDPDHFLTCIWFVDTDENASTGQLHSGIGSDYNLRANLREHWFHGQAFIDPIPPVGAAWPAGTVGVQHVEEATATVRMVVRREQIGMPGRFQWSCAVFSHASSGDRIDLAAEAVVGSDPPPAGTVVRVLVEPTICLRDGVTTRSMRVRAYDSQGNRLGMEGRDTILYPYQDGLSRAGEFITAQPSRVTRTRVSALVDGVVSWNAGEVMVGSLLLRPAVILLDTGANSAGYVTLEARAADGSLVSHSGHNVFMVNDDDTVAEFDPDTGKLVARSTGEGRQTCVRAWWDDIPANNWCCVRVVKGGVIGPMPTAYAGRYCCYWLPGSLVLDATSGVSVDEMMERWDVAHSMDAAHSLMCRLLGTSPWVGDVQDLAGIEEDTIFKICGVSGNPIGLGYDPTRPVSCIQDGLGAPNFGVHAHEVGHNVAGASQPLCEGLYPWGLSHSSSYCEGIATLLNMYAQAGFIEGPGHYGVDADMVAAAGDMRVYASLVHCREAFLGALDEYVRDGSNYDDLDADVVDGIFVQLADAYGWNLYEKFFSAFWPPNASFAFEVDTEAEQATMLVAALSAAADADLRPLFRDQWGFPADDGFYETAMPLLRERIRWRGEDFHWIFDDVPPSHLAFREIAAIADATIARGYSASPPTYSPHLAVTRNQMAVYVSRSMAGADTYVPPGPIVPHFVDVPSDDVCYKYIEYAVANEVVFGYPDGLYHPEYEVDRGQMAVFIARATATPTGEPGMVDYTPPATPTFADVTADPLDPYQACYKYVEYIAEQGVTHGYPDGLYHPEYIVSRGLMAIYVARAFQLPM